MKEQCPYELEPRPFWNSMSHPTTADLNDRELGVSAVTFGVYRFSINDGGTIYYVAGGDKP